MPIYEYRCQDCGMTVELLQKMGATEAGVACPNCNSTQLKKLISAHAVTKSGAVQNNNSVCERAPICGSSSCCGGSCHGH
ncbi:MAG TPA: zinc ribbon domain-containing protein [Bacillota bacterium]|nr:zinc ribbon domain-containing protein [Bacillota bacterium]HOL10090.1 zinc ribbon domain-containing protein [Bacillota bacterium]HPO98919.1 zinc ribbon domain-containing protein [Bacillota bacterium]